MAFRFGTEGNVALIFALTAPLLIGVAGGALDFQSLGLQRTGLQDAADNLATRGAREFLLENSTPAQIEALVQATADAQYEDRLGAFSLGVEADAEEKSVAVELTQAPRRGFFLHALPAFSGDLSATATAVARGTSDVCVVALEDEKDGAVRAEAGARLIASKCSILSNSKSSRGIDAAGFSKLRASLICSAGGARGGSQNFDPPALTDCPHYEDPLIERLPPDVGACDADGLTLGSSGALSGLALTALTSVVSLLDGADDETLVGYTRYDLEPGVYCNGLKIRSDADVHLAPGVYVIKDGPLEVELGGRIFGKNVGLYFTGDDAVFTFKPQSIVHLTAPADGIMAGMLIMEDRERADTETYAILSANARTLLGTIYLPQGRLHVDSLMPVADASAYTAIVTRYLRLSGSPELVLNTDYALTDVPVPAGIGATGGQVFLRD
ncbi:MAG: pilus assembly protein TadG-related protein [Parvularculaceae bacterium]